MTRIDFAAICARCGLRVLDADTDAIPVVLDTTPLSRAGEALALIAGRDTFCMRRTGTGFEVYYRDHFRIGGDPAGTAGMDILVRHQCDNRVDFPRIPTAFPYRPIVLTPENPPF